MDEIEMDSEPGRAARQRGSAAGQERNRRALGRELQVQPSGTGTRRRKATQFAAAVVGAAPTCKV